MTCEYRLEGSEKENHVEMPGGNIQSKRNSKVQALRQKCAWYIKKIMKCQNGGNRMSKESGRRGGRHVGGGG